ncbi:DUF2946 domain-containing protein [Janthinobacterium sp.]|uniref:DUF2946 domain-containing protein n=1 Tax=Janthinobacterium sp. TaxID=1871054 RepID=UPI00293D67A5|nr:DUF2946 domain-containing protein [Janthinobacterium sp.]
MKNITRRFAAWLACFAMLFAALAPSISHAVSASRGETFAEICGVAGAKLVQTATAEGAASIPLTQKSMQFEHCPLCAPHAGSFALPPSAALVVPLLEQQDSHPFLFFQSPRPLTIWTVAQSRAPPAQI